MSFWASMGCFFSTSTTDGRSCFFACSTDWVNGFCSSAHDVFPDFFASSPIPFSQVVGCFLPHFPLHSTPSIQSAIFARKDYITTPSLPLLTVSPFQKHTEFPLFFFREFTQWIFEGEDLTVQLLAHRNFPLIFPNETLQGGERRRGYNNKQPFAPRTPSSTPTRLSTQAPTPPEHY